jgi:hypothetical protein
MLPLDGYRCNGPKADLKSATEQSDGSVAGDENIPPPGRRSDRVGDLRPLVWAGPISLIPQTDIVAEILKPKPNEPPPPAQPEAKPKRTRKRAGYDSTADTGVRVFPFRAPAISLA